MTIAVVAEPLASAGRRRPHRLNLAKAGLRTLAVTPARKPVEIMRRVVPCIG
jgi:hypothetical protein